MQKTANVGEGSKNAGLLNYLKLRDQQLKITRHTYTYLMIITYQRIHKQKRENNPNIKIVITSQRETKK